MKRSLLLFSLLGHLAWCRADAVRLQINGPDGKPVAGAKVRVIESSGTWFKRKTVASLDLTSDAAGRISFESKTPMAKPNAARPMDAEPSQVVATVRAPGLAFGGVWLKAGDNELKLGKGQTFEGTVLDDAQKPVAGVRLVVSNIGGDGQLSALNTATELQSTTDANGRFRFEALPITGTVSVQSDDPAWKRETFELDLVKPAPPLFLERGATLRGRMLKPDGTPAANVKFFAGDYEHQPTTRADGTFEATGLGEKSLYLQIIGGDEQKLPFIVPYKSVEGLKAGQVRDIGDWKTQKGVRIKGRIVASDTKKPIPSASISLWGRGDAQGQANAQGVFDVLCSPDASMATVRADGFVAVIKPGIAATPKNGVVDLGTIELKRGKKVSGILLDGKGNALANRSIRARKKNGNTGDSWAQSGADGRFSFEGLDSGEYTLLGEGFKITSGEKFSVGAATAPPLRVVGTGTNTNAADEKQVVSGRAQDLDGQPVAGAKIEMRLQGANGSYQPKSVLSQLDGTFSATFSGFADGKLKVVKIKRPGFAPGTSAVTKDGDKWRVEIALQPKGSALRGRVLNAAGEGVAGVFVGLRDGYDLPVTTDKNGDFALEEAPLRDVTILVSDGPSLASFAIKNAPNKTEITLPAAPPEADKIALADTVLSGGSLGWAWKGAWEVLGAKRVEAIVMGAGIGEGNGNKEWAWGEFLGELARREPKTFLAREAELRAATSQQFLPRFERLLMLSRASNGDDAQKTMVRDYLQKQEAEKREVSAATVEQLLHLAQISADLEPKGGAMWLDYAAQIAEQLTDNGGQSAWNWGKTIARVDKSAPLSFGDDWKPTAQLMLLNSAMSFYVESSDLESARMAWQRSQKLGEQAAQNPDADLKPREYGPRAADLVKQTAGSYATILARTDPRAALALSSSVSEYEQVKLLNAIAQNAAKAEQFDVAKKAIEATFAVPLGNVEFVAEAARVAQSFDPAFAATVWPRAYAKARPSADDEGRGYQPSLAAYADARAAFAPGESRILIEREWQKRLDAVKPDADENDNSDFDQNGRALSALVAAMAKVSPTRALEMLDKVPEKQNLRAQTRTDIALELLRP